MGTILGAEVKEKNTDCFPVLLYLAFSQKRQIYTMEYNMDSMFLWDIRESFPQEMIFELMSERWVRLDWSNLKARERSQARSTDVWRFRSKRQHRALENQEACGVTVAWSYVGGAGGEAGGTSRRSVMERYTLEGILCFDFVLRILVNFTMSLNWGMV